MTVRGKVVVATGGGSGMGRMLVLACVCAALAGCGAPPTAPPPAPAPVPAPRPAPAPPTAPPPAPKPSAAKPPPPPPPPLPPEPCSEALLASLVVPDRKVSLKLAPPASDGALRGILVVDARGAVPETLSAIQRRARAADVQIERWTPTESEQIRLELRCARP